MWLHFSSDFEGARNKLLKFEQMQEENNAREAVMTKKHGRLLNLTTRVDSLLNQEFNEYTRIGLVANLIATITGLLRIFSEHLSPSLVAEIIQI